MNNLTELFKHIEQLSPENRALLQKYVEFLTWQEAQQHAQAGQTWSYSFIETFEQASVHASDNPAGMDVKMAPASVGGQSQPALWAHPPVSGQTIIEYHVPVPQQVQNVRLKLWYGIRDGAEIAENNLVAFGVKMNGLRVWGTQSNAREWQAVDIPLDLTAGDIVRFELTTEALGSHRWTWAVWGSPELVGGAG